MNEEENESRSMSHRETKIARWINKNGRRWGQSQKRKSENNSDYADPERIRIIEKQIVCCFIRSLNNRRGEGKWSEKGEAKRATRTRKGGGKETQDRRRRKRQRPEEKRNAITREKKRKDREERKRQWTITIKDIHELISVREGVDEWMQPSTSITRNNFEMVRENEKINNQGRARRGVTTTEDRRTIAKNESIDRRHQQGYFPELLTHTL